MATWSASLEAGEPRLYSLLHSPTASSPKEATLALHFPSKEEMGIEALENRKTMNHAMAALKNVAGYEIEILVTHAEPKNVEKHKPTKEELIEKAKQIPSVKNALDLFPGSKIIDVEE